MQPKQPKAETQAMSNFGEPWELVQFGNGGWWVRDSVGTPSGVEMDLRNGERLVACVNAMQGIPNPEAVRELIEAAVKWRKAQLTGRSLDRSDMRLMDAIGALSAPPASPQQK